MLRIMAQRTRLWLHPKKVTGSVVRYRPDCIGIALFWRYPYDDYRFERRNRLPGTELQKYL